MNKKNSDAFGMLLIGSVVLVIIVLLGFAAYHTLNKPSISQYNVFLIDVSSPLTPQQKDQLKNMFEDYIKESPVNSKHVFYKVDEIKDQLLKPVVEGVSNYSEKDKNYFTSSPEREKKVWAKKFEQPFLAALETTTASSDSKNSPILESIKSVVISTLNKYEAKGKPKRLILVSDLMQHTSSLNFYKEIPDYKLLKQNPEFRNLRIDLTGIDFEIWWLNPSNNPAVYNKLQSIWLQIIYDQMGTIKSEGKDGGFKKII